jgi:hypothetical protein
MFAATSAPCSAANRSCRERRSRCARRARRPPQMNRYALPACLGAQTAVSRNPPRRRILRQRSLMMWYAYGDPGFPLVPSISVQACGGWQQGIGGAVVVSQSINGCRAKRSASYDAIGNHITHRRLDSSSRRHRRRHRPCHRSGWSVSCPPWCCVSLG